MWRSLPGPSRGSMDLLLSMPVGKLPGKQCRQDPNAIVDPEKDNLFNGLGSAHRLFEGMAELTTLDKDDELGSATMKCSGSELQQ